MRYDDPAARDLYHILRDLEWQRPYANIADLIGHAAEQTGRSVVELARVVLDHDLASELETFSPAAWRSDAATRRRLAASIRSAGRIDASRWPGVDRWPWLAPRS